MAQIRADKAKACDSYPLAWKIELISSGCDEFMANPSGKGNDGEIIVTFMAMRSRQYRQTPATHSPYAGQLSTARSRFLHRYVPAVVT